MDSLPLTGLERESLDVRVSWNNTLTLTAEQKEKKKKEEEEM